MAAKDPFTAFVVELIDNDGHHDSRAPISVYTIEGGILRCLGDTTDGGVVAGIRMWREDGEIDGNSPIGIRDRDAQVWLANPFATGRKR